MEKKQKVLELRQRLDKTLALPDLVNEESIKSLVKNQRLCSSLCGNEGDLENVVSRRTKEVSNFLEMLRSTSENEIDAFKSRGASQHDWKIKQDTDELRVLYREGTRFHALLTEGCADGSIDVCVSRGSQLCIRNGGHNPTFRLSKLPWRPLCRKFELVKKFH